MKCGWTPIAGVLDPEAGWCPDEMAAGAAVAATTAAALISAMGSRLRNRLVATRMRSPFHRVACVARVNPERAPTHLTVARWLDVIPRAVPDEVVSPKLGVAGSGRVRWRLDEMSGLCTAGGARGCIKPEVVRARPRAARTCRRPGPDELARAFRAADALLAWLRTHRAEPAASGRTKQRRQR